MALAEESGQDEETWKWPVFAVGGVIGAVVEVKPDTVVLKVDESSNTRMTFSRDAIQQIIDVDTTTVEEGSSDS